MEAVKPVKFNSKRTEYKLDNGFVYRTLSNVTLEGDNIDFAIVNTLRHVTLTYIPMYVFNNVTITKNSSVYDNDTIKMRMKNFPVPIKNEKTIYIPPKPKDVELEVILEDDDEYYGDSLSEQEISTSSLEELTMYVKMKNYKDKKLDITTDDCKYYKDGVEIKNPYKNPLIIVSLQLNQEIEMTCITELQIEKNNASFTAVNEFGYDELNEHKFENLPGLLTKKLPLQLFRCNRKELLSASHLPIWNNAKHPE